MSEDKADYSGKPWSGQERWPQCARCRTSRPLATLEQVGGQLVCGDRQWCFDQAKALGLVPEDEPFTKPAEVSPLEPSPPAPSVPDLGGES